MVSRSWWIGWARAFQAWRERRSWKEEFWYNRLWEFWYNRLWALVVRSWKVLRLARTYPFLIQNILSSLRGPDQEENLPFKYWAGTIRGIVEQVFGLEYQGWVVRKTQAFLSDQKFALNHEHGNPWLQGSRRHWCQHILYGVSALCRIQKAHPGWFSAESAELLRLLIDDIQTVTGVRRTARGWDYYTLGVTL